MASPNRRKCTIESRLSKNNLIPITSGRFETPRPLGESIVRIAIFTHRVATSQRSSTAHYKGLVEGGKVNKTKGPGAHLQGKMRFRARLFRGCCSSRSSLRGHMCVPIRDSGWPPRILGLRFNRSKDAHTREVADLINKRLNSSRGCCHRLQTGGRSWLGPRCSAEGFCLYPIFFAYYATNMATIVSNLCYTITDVQTFSIIVRYVWLRPEFAQVREGRFLTLPPTLSVVGSSWWARNSKKYAFVQRTSGV